MAKVILVEGISDAVLLSELLVATKKYKIVHADEGEIRPKPDPKKNEMSITMHDPKQKTLIVFACGSCTRFAKCYNDYFEYDATSGKIERIAILRDADENTAEQLKQNLTNSFKHKLSFEIGKWTQNTLIEVEFGTRKEQIVESLLVIVPSNSKGILETALLNAIAENNSGKDESIVAKESIAFAQHLKKSQNKYLQTNREEKKAALGFTICAFNPDHGYQTLKPFFKSVRWSRFPNIASIFSMLLDI